MNLIIGIGNPGSKYEKNRHNVGFMVIDAIASQASKQFSKSNFQTNKKLRATIWYQKTTDTLFAKSTTQMNSSGEAVSKLANFYKVKPVELWVIHDDLDIKLGQYKIQKGKGPKIHKGLLSVYEKLGKGSFWHVRVGVENRQKKFSLLGFQYPKRIPGERYVLQNFTDKEFEILKPVIDKIIIELNNYLTNR
jgi:PTH1 family peptidyl-tRNA hydrolase